MNGQTVESSREHFAHTAKTHLDPLFAPNDHAPALECVAADGAPGANRKLTAVGCWLADRYAKVFLAAGAGTSDVSVHAQSLKWWS